MQTSKYVFGVDFGTTNTCISYYDRITDKFGLINNECGDYIIPSCIIFDSDTDEIVFGLDTSDSVKYIKRLFCVKYDNYIQNDELKNTFRNLYGIQENEQTGYCNIVIQGYKTFSVEYLVSKYIEYIYRLICTFSETDSEFEVVITVPVEFSEIQKKEYKKIFTDIGFCVQRVITEPVSAVIWKSNNLDHQSLMCDYVNILIVDIGGGTTDFSVVKIDKANCIYEITNTTGIKHLGGENFTNNLSKYIETKCKNILHRKYRQTDIQFSHKQLQAIRRESERCKIGLSKNLVYKIILISFYDDIYLDFEISRNEFINCNKTYFDELVNKLTEIKNSSEIIHSYILTGGGSKIPHIDQLCKKVLDINTENSEKFNLTDNRDISDEKTVVSLGATLQCCLLTDCVGDSLQDFSDNFLLMDTVCHTYGIKTKGNIMTPIISRFSKIPIENSEIFTNSETTGSFDIEIYRGEYPITEHNELVDIIKLDTGKTSCEIGEYKIQVCFEVTSDNILVATGKILGIGENNRSFTAFTNINITDNQTENAANIPDVDLEKLLRDLETTKRRQKMLELEDLYIRINKIRRLPDYITDYLQEISCVLLEYEKYSVDELQSFIKQLEDKMLI
jgi:molecular chaperone DnaK